MAELMHRAKINPGKIKNLALFIFAPEEQIDACAFSTQSDPDHINETVKRRVSEYKGDKDKWYHEWFLPTLSRMTIKCLSWESIIEKEKHRGRPLKGVSMKKTTPHQKKHFCFFFDTSVVIGSVFSC